MRIFVFCAKVKPEVFLAPTNYSAKTTTLKLFCICIPKYNLSISELIISPKFGLKTYARSFYSKSKSYPLRGLHHLRNSYYCNTLTPHRIPAKIYF